MNTTLQSACRISRPFFHVVWRTHSIRFTIIHRSVPVVYWSTGRYGYRPSLYTASERCFECVSRIKKIIFLLMSFHEIPLKRKKNPRATARRCATCECKVLIESSVSVFRFWIFDWKLFLKRAFFSRSEITFQLGKFSVRLS